MSILKIVNILCDYLEMGQISSQKEENEKVPFTKKIKKIVKKIFERTQGRLLFEGKLFFIILLVFDFKQGRFITFNFRCNICDLFFIIFLNFSSLPKRKWRKMMMKRTRKRKRKNWKKLWSLWSIQFLSNQLNFSYIFCSCMSFPSVSFYPIFHSHKLVLNTEEEEKRKTFTPWGFQDGTMSFWIYNLRSILCIFLFFNQFSRFEKIASLTIGVIHFLA